MSNVIVIGGGASGLMAAYTAAKNGHRVLLIEKNEKLGKKIYITGKGRCNVTNAIEAEEFLQKVVHGEKFLKGAIHRFSPFDMMNFLSSYSLALKTERGNRVFPVSDHASDVTKTFERALSSVGVEVRLNEEVKRIRFETVNEKKKICGIETQHGEIDADVVIVATGGLSYPTTGSTGDGYRFAEEGGHTLEPMRPALCGLNVKGSIFSKLQGLTLKNVRLACFENVKSIFGDIGELLFTHSGISGPLVLSLSSMICRKDLKNIKLYLDMKPALDEIALDKRILRDFEQYKNKQTVHAMKDLLPQKMISVVLNTAHIDEKKNVNVLTKEERIRIVKALKAFPIEIQSLCGFSEAVVTSGGVNLKEIDPKTMSSKLVDGLKFCGEVLDVDAFTGGFNLQIAFSTGYVAGSF